MAKTIEELFVHELEDLRKEISDLRKIKGEYEFEITCFKNALQYLTIYKTPSNNEWVELSIDSWDTEKKAAFEFLKGYAHYEKEEESGYAE